MNKKELINKILKLNPNIKQNELLFRLDGRIEYICQHGVGHTIYYPKGSDGVHGCDGCCKNIKVIKNV